MPEKSNPAPHISRAEWLIVLACCAAASITAILWSWRNNAMLNYGDAVAHLHIARRVFDAHQPRLTELGSVWLPLPHLLLIPFVQIYSWWASGFAGVIPSALAYLAACAGIYRLARHWLRPAPSALALAFFALNPNLLYLQTTAMTEPLFICEMVWVAVWLVEWRASLDADSEAIPPPALVHCSWRSWPPIFTRYDGWIMALSAWTCMGLTLARRGRLRSPGFWIASVLLIAAPIAWFIYNSVGFGDWLYFLRGPYSAKAIEIRTSVPGFPPHPGWHNPWVALIFLHQGRGAGRGRSGLGQHSADPEPAGNSVGLAHGAQACIHLGAAAVVSGRLLCVFGLVWLGAHLSAHLVAALLVQPALRNGASAGLCAGAWLCRADCILSAVDEFKPSRGQP